MDWKMALAASTESTEQWRIPMTHHLGADKQFDAVVARVRGEMEYSCRVNAVDERFHMNFSEEQVITHLQANDIDPTDGWY